MSKKLIHKYTFDASAQTITLDGIHGRDRLLMISNVTRNVVLYVFNNPSLGLSNYSIDTVTETTTLSLVLDTTAMQDGDVLQIFLETDSQSFTPDETYTDPVSKFRVSQPENLIDTDFEYGLQSTKWETLELVKNIPTFFSRNGDSDIAVASMTTLSGSNLINVETTDPHGLVQGNPIIVQGALVNTANGAFVVTKIIDVNTFEYTAKRNSAFTGNILDTYTQVFLGSIYQGSEFKLSNLNGITTDGLTPSTLTVTTDYPLGFLPETSFFLTNSVGQKIVNFNSASTTYENFQNIGQSRVANTATGETDDWALAGIYAQRWKPKASETKWFVAGTAGNSTITVNIATGQEYIQFNDGGHGFTDGEYVVYLEGWDNTALGGLTDTRPYWVRTDGLSDPLTQMRLTTVSSTSTSYVNLTNAGTTNNMTRSCFVRAYDPIQTFTGPADEKVRFQTEIPFIANDRNQAVAIMYTAVGGIPVVANGTDFNSYTSASTQIQYTKNVQVTANQTTCQFSTSPNGATTNISVATVTGALILIDPAPLADTLYFPAHGLKTGDVVFFDSTSTSVPITKATYFYVTAVTPDRLRFRTFNTTSDFNITSYGSVTATIEISGYTYIDGADVLSAPSHGLSNGDVVVYTNEGGASIGALTNGLTYYVSQSTTNTLQLATTASGLETPNITINNLATGTGATGYIHATYRYIIKTAHGFVTGDRVQYTSSTPIGGMRNGAFYYIYRVDGSNFYVHRTANGAVTNTASDRIWFSQPLSGTSRFRKTTIVDLTSAGTGSQRLTANVDGASDGVYNVSTIVDDTTFQMLTNTQIPTRTIQFDPASSVYIEEDAIRIPDHYFRNGYEVVLSTVGTVPTGLTAGETYFVLRVSRNWFRLCATLEDSESNIYIPLTGTGSGLATLSTANLIGEVLGSGTVSTELESTLLSGTGSNFTSFFKTGDAINIYHAEEYTVKAVASITTSTQWNTSGVHGWATGQLVILRAEVQPTGSLSGSFYYVRVIDTDTVQLHPTLADANANLNRITVSDAGTSVSLEGLVTIGSTEPNRVENVLSASKIQLAEASANTTGGLEYSVGTSLLVRADGFALHRPYDGGVELIPSSNPDSQMIRQTRRYFRYQSGKGIQVSFAVNFSPTTSMERIVTDGSTTTATVYTKFPHRLTVGLDLTFTGVPLVGAVNVFNGVHTVASIVDDYSFTVTLATVVAATSTGGFGEFYVNNWTNSNLRCGLFDDQNGMYFEYDGQQLSVCRRSSTQQISGYLTVTFRQGVVFGTDTKFTSQLAVGEYLVIRGQSYLITKIADDVTLYIAPSYRGVTASRVIGTKTTVEKVTQANWNNDKVDGTGKTGYAIDIHKIQMAYIDYSWYGAGKIRFGFKDQNGNVKYVHQFVHNNKKTEAYLRSGNLPARYDIQNIGKPTYVPALAHWGTSVIMDGGFDDDRAYIFNAQSPDIQVTGSNTVSVTGRVAYRNNIYYGLDNNRLRALNYALLINQSNSYNQIPQGAIITGAGLQANTQIANPRDNQFDAKPYFPSIVSSEGYQPSNLDVRNLLLLDRVPTATAGSNSTYTVTLSNAALPVVYDIPLISVRLAPSVDTNTIGLLGEREIINRMQLTLSQVGILSTHTAEIYLILNGSIDNAEWERVTNPSLSQLVYHKPQDAITGGTKIYSFRAQGGVGATGRTPIATTENLGEVATLGNSILGGNNTYPDGPDVLTIVARLTEDPSSVSAAQPFAVSGRISWVESQA